MSDNQSENSVHWQDVQTALKELVNAPQVFEITGFELLESGGDGYTEKRVAIISDKTEAFKWVQESNAYRRMNYIKQVIVVHPTLDSLKAYQVEELKQKALAKLTLEERRALGFPVTL